MTASDWKAKARDGASAVELPLPSGMIVKARRPDPLQFLQWQILPTMLVNLARNTPTEVSDEEAKTIADLLRELLVWCCLEPRVSTAPIEGEIHPGEIPDGDLWFIVAWAMRLQEVQSFRPFRRERTNADAGDGGQAVLLQAVEPADNTGPVDRPGVRPGGSAKDSGGRERG